MREGRHFRYVSRTGSIEDILAAVGAAICGELYYLPRTSALVIQPYGAFVRKTDPLAGDDVLTRREREIVGLVEQGLSNKEIARSLETGNARVRNQIHSILSKMQVRRRGEAAAWIRRANTGTPRMIALAALPRRFR